MLTPDVRAPDMKCISHLSTIAARPATMPTASDNIIMRFFSFIWRSRHMRNASHQLCRRRRAGEYEDNGVCKISDY